LKTFKEFLADSTPNYEWLTFSVDHYQVHILFECISGEVLTEAKHKGLPLGGEYSAQLHKAHSPVGQDHIHVYGKNNQLGTPEKAKSTAAQLVSAIERR
jgi:hypothetical protein